MKKELSEEALRLIADRFKALSEPLRLRLIMAVESGEKNVTELVEETSAGQANVSRHLQRLTSAGILRRTKKGLHAYYCIADQTVFDLCQVVCGSLEKHLQDHTSNFQGGIMYEIWSETVLRSHAVRSMPGGIFFTFI